jgi:hypothetical protein
MNSQNTKSSKELKREVLNELDKVEKDLDHIESKMTPGQIIDSALFAGPNIRLADTLERLKANPIGTSFLTFGTLLLKEDETHQSYESHLKKETSDMVDKSKAKIQMRSAEKQREKDMTPSRSDITQNNIHNKVEGLKDQAHQAKESAQAKLNEMKEKTSTGMNSLRSSSENLKLKAQEGVHKVGHLEPLTYVALGLGLGSLTGASLPVMEAEQRAVDNNLNEKLSDFSRDMQDALNQSANIFKNEIVSDLKGMNIHFF